MCDGWGNCQDIVERTGKGNVGDVIRLLSEGMDDLRGGMKKCAEDRQGRRILSAMRTGRVLLKIYE